MTAPLSLRILSVPAVAAVVLLGIWVTGALITNDFAVSMWLTVAWMGAAALACGAIALRSRAFRVPVAAAYVATAAAAGIYLALPLLFDTTVNERVAVASATTAQLAAGSFEGVAHAGAGTATVLGSRGERVLTLTDFEVDNGPDLRVYLVAGSPADESGVDDFVDLGALKGNKGNQQYAIPAGTDTERYSTVVIWCRAFSVLFARAQLGP
jgi:hypothetical protein